MRWWIERGEALRWSEALGALCFGVPVAAEGPEEGG